MKTITVNNGRTTITETQVVTGLAAGGALLNGSIAALLYAKGYPRAALAFALWSVASIAGGLEAQR